MVLAVAWAVYLIPKALRHHDEVARTRSIDRFSTAMRVLARREPVSRRDARLVVSPARAAGNPRVITPSRSAEPEAPVAVAVKPAVSRSRLEARRKAAQHRWQNDPYHGATIAQLPEIGSTPRRACSRNREGEFPGAEPAHADRCRQTDWTGARDRLD